MDTPLSAFASEKSKPQRDVDAVVESITWMIVSAELQPRQHLPEADLVQRVSKDLDQKVSKTHVRIALERLRDQGLIEHVPNAGCRVKAIPVQELHQVLVVRFGIESYFARLLAHKVSQSPEGESLMEPLFESLEQMKNLCDAMRQSDPNDRAHRLEFTKRDLEFHCLPPSLCGYPVGANIIRTLATQCLYHTAANQTFVGDTCCVIVREHRAAVDGIKENSHDAINQAFQHHFDGTRKRWAEVHDHDAYLV